MCPRARGGTIARSWMKFWMRLRRGSARSNQERQINTNNKGRSP
jgi:hypothetical protein